MTAADPAPAREDWTPALAGPAHHVVLSPHLDDAVVSLGGMLARLVAHDVRPTVLTAFAGHPEPPYPEAARALHRAWRLTGDPLGPRLKEDAAALALLGARPLRGALVDAIYRRAADGAALYGATASFFGPLRGEDEPLVAEIVALVRSHFEASGTRLYASLGIGGHVDHVLVSRAGLELAAGGFDVWFYAELPYAADPRATHGRLAELPPMHAGAVGFGPAELARKQAAILRYESQIRTLFSDDALLRAAVEAQAAESRPPGGAPYGERLHRLAGG
jgi:LmbE family N-acetylglucosaminyl deacetylase